MAGGHPCCCRTGLPLSSGGIALPSSSGIPGGSIPGGSDGSGSIPCTKRCLQFDPTDDEVCSVWIDLSGISVIDGSCDECSNLTSIMGLATACDAINNLCATDLESVCCWGDPNEYDVCAGQDTGGLDCESGDCTGYNNLGLCVGQADLGSPNLWTFAVTFHSNNLELECRTILCWREEFNLGRSYLLPSDLTRTITGGSVIAGGGCGDCLISVTSSVDISVASQAECCSCE